jgi:hypothetical protein
MLYPGDPGFMEAMLRDPTQGAAPPNLVRQMHSRAGRRALGVRGGEEGPNDAPETTGERPPAKQAQRRGPFATGNQMYNPGMVANVAGAMTGAQGNALQNMIGQTTNAWRDEHDSRVSQNREARRMEHEKEVERMRIEALLKRLEMEKSQGPQPLASGRGFTIR